MPFKDLGLHASLVQAIRDMRYEQPTPVQAEAIPAVLAGRDVIATAQTGTGKTAAFLLPILHRLLSEPRNTTRALVVTPTRELAQQIDDVMLGLAYHTGLRSGVLVGGVSMGPQEKALRAGVELLIATPGRLLDHMRHNQGRFDQIHTLVLDEADRMLDMGFIPDIERIFARLPARKQTLLFSATMPPVIAQLSRDTLKNPLTIQIGKRSAPAVGITQAAYPCAEHLKTPLLRHLLRNNDMPSVLVFTRTKQSAKRLARIISGDGFAVAELHSNLSMPQRMRAMESSPHRPHRPRRIGRRRFRVGGAGGREEPGAHRAADRTTTAARDAAGFRLQAGGADEARAQGELPSRLARPGAEGTTSRRQQRSAQALNCPDPMNMGTTNKRTARVDHPAVLFPF